MRNTVDRVACKNMDRLTGVHLYLYDVALGGMMMAKAFAGTTTRTGHYQRSIYFTGTRGGGRPAKAQFGSTDFKAWWIEFGANPSRVRSKTTGKIIGRPVHFVARHVMENAAHAMGLRFIRNHGGPRPKKIGR